MENLVAVKKVLDDVNLYYRPVLSSHGLWEIILLKRAVRGERVWNALMRVGRMNDVQVRITMDRVVILGRG